MNVQCSFSFKEDHSTVKRWQNTCLGGRNSRFYLVAPGLASFIPFLYAYIYKGTTLFYISV